jgi:hypothetical protein
MLATVNGNTGRRGDFLTLAFFEEFPKDWIILCLGLDTAAASQCLE